MILSTLWIIRTMVPSPTAAPRRTPTTGAARYRLLRPLAVGGMGELFLASADAPGGVQKLVAVKRIRPEYASDPTFVAMFLNEARLAATLDHPNIVRTYDLVEDAGNFFLVMEYLHGESLGALLNATVSADGRVPVPQILTVGLGVSAGLHCAHDRKGIDGHPLDIVHRDLSPGNVFVTYSGDVKLLDFGIAKATSRTSITLGPTRKGKAGYMSPEQCVGDDIDRRSDIFALGTVMWELSTGQRLFRGDNEFSIMNQITTLDAPRANDVVAEIPEGLANIIAKALRRDRTERFQTAMQMHHELEALASRLGSMPSMTALGRYVEQTCGTKDFPSAEPSEAFRTEVTVVSNHAEIPPIVRKPRHLGVIAALIVGVTMGAVGATSASNDEPAPAPRRGLDAAGLQPGPVQTGLAAAGPTPATAPDPMLGPDAPQPINATQTAPASAGTDSTAPPVAPRPSPKRKSRRPQKPKRSTPVTKPVRGVDGLLPSG